MNYRSSRFVTSLAVLVVVFTLAVPALAQTGGSGAIVEKSPNGVYLVRMIDEPVVAYEGGIKGLKATKPRRGEKIDPNSPAVVNYVAHLDSRHDQALGLVGGQKLYDYRYTFNGFAAKLTLDQAQQLASVDGVLKVSPDELQTMDTDSTPDFLGLTAEGGLWDQGWVGEDVIIGVVDSGIWPEAMSFSDRTGTNPNGKEGKLDYHQIPGWHGKCTPGEGFNASMCNQKLIGAQYYNAGYGGNAGIDADRPWEFNSPRDYNGHGTHTTSTAGGNQGVEAEVDGVPLGSISGMAPRARVSAYKALWSNEEGSQASGFTVDLVAAIDQAVADGVDVINYSISGSTSILNTSVSIAFLYAADAGVFVAASAGNSGPGASTVAHNGPWITTVGAMEDDQVFWAGLEVSDPASIAAVYGGPEGVSDVSLADTGDIMAEVVPSEPADGCSAFTNAADVDGNIALVIRGVCAFSDKYNNAAAAGAQAIVVYNDGATPDRVYPIVMSAPGTTIPGIMISNPDGALVAATAASETVTGMVGPSIVFPRVDRIADFSSRGPAIAGDGDLLKPDIVAPGVNILAAVAPPGNGGRNFDFYSGTSMSSPHMAGIAALMKDAHPDWSPMMIKSALMTTTRQNLRKTYADAPADPFDMGAGLVVPNSAVDPGLVYDAGWLDWLAFLCETSNAVSAGTCGALQSMGYSLDPSDLNYPSIAIGALAGTQTITRTVTNVGPAGTYNVSVDAPPGIDVTVDPASVTLAEGESATYWVTFTVNPSVVYDVYTFGSLTWSDGSHDVTSPIALKPVVFFAPDEVQGTGTDGSLSFGISFGYTGDYTAAAHGLDPALMTDGYVEDDPGNSFAPFGPGTTLHMINVPAGSVYARFSLFDAYTDGNDDLDLYVYYPWGAYAGGSGSGTSAEQVDIGFPPAGDYYVFVHGYATDGPDANYTLFSWAVDGDSGNMTITAPAAATVGNATVTVDWAGLTAGTKYLGAVSHSDPGLLGLTLIAVDTD